MSEQHETATFAGGCFWCLEATFSQLEGVSSVVSGYAGGPAENPSYEQVSGGSTGHAETVQITFDPAIISYPDLLEVFFAVHDPTTLNRQGADVGTQYRSVIFYHSPEQKSAAESVIKELEASKTFNNKIVTRIEPFTKFYRAEEYHQQYFSKHPHEPYCQVVINPKVAKLRQKFASRLKASSVK